MFKVGDLVELAYYTEYSDSDSYQTWYDPAYRGVIGSVLKIDDAESVYVKWSVPEDFPDKPPKSNGWWGNHTWWYHPSDLRPAEALDMWVRQVRKERGL